MIRRKTIYRIHRWIALIASLQLLAWSVGGFVFSILDIQDVRGESDRAAPVKKPLPFEQVKFVPEQAVNICRNAGYTGAVSEVRIFTRVGNPVFEIRLNEENVCIVDAVSMSVVDRISSIDAERVATADFLPHAVVKSVDLFEQDAPPEYRGGELPAYRVVLDHPRKPHIYVSARTGEVTKRRNKLWRTFDFFWMLHIMDYQGRENFNHALLSGMSLVAILTSVSGLMLWWWRIPWKKVSDGGA